jgi:hypothetical protein
MKALPHAIVGATTGYMFSGILGTDPLKTIAISTFSSLVVDIDKEDSTINKILFLLVPVKYRNSIKAVVGLIMMALGTYIVRNPMMQYLGAIFFISTISTKVEYRFSLFDGLERREFHRTLFHHPIIGAIVFLIPLQILNIPDDYKTAFVAGLMIGHYLMDSFTKYGLPFFPFKKMIRMPIYYDSYKYPAIEYIIVTAYVMLLTTLKYPQIWDTISNFL